MIADPDERTLRLIRCFVRHICGSVADAIGWCDRKRALGWRCDSISERAPGVWVAEATLTEEETPC